MSYEYLLKNLGFDSDPFLKTNADEEERIDKYFIEPPFFPAVLGQTSSPKSSIVFAPRGNGKTALKRKIEITSYESDFLCITYNTFPVAQLNLNEINQEYHLRNLIKLLLVSIISVVSIGGIDKLDKNERHFLYLFIRGYLNEINRNELKTAISSIKNFGDKAFDIWNKFTGPIGLVINSLLNQLGIAQVEITRYNQQGGKLGNYIEQLDLLQSITRKFGYKSIYILIDKVDENILTSGVENSYKFIEPLLKDLQLLELKPYAFKFFLWDLLLNNYRTVARPDRVKYYEIKWTPAQLKNMLSKRLKAYSNDKIISLSELMEYTGKFNLDEFICYFAQGSPRNVIRICKEIIDQQSDIDYNSQKLSTAAIERGFNVISQNISHEKYSESLIKDLVKTKRCDFTIRYIYSDVFKFTQQAALNKIKGWENAGAVKLLGKIQETKGAKTSNHYGISDLLLAKTVFDELSIFDFASTKIIICTCGRILLRDWDIKPLQACEECQKEIDDNLI